MKIEFDTGWVHLRTSNTEPIIRIYAENITAVDADKSAKSIMFEIEQFLKNNE